MHGNIVIAICISVGFVLLAVYMWVSTSRKQEAALFCRQEEFRRLLAERGITCTVTDTEFYFTRGEARYDVPVWGDEYPSGPEYQVDVIERHLMKQEQGK